MRLCKLLVSLQKRYIRVLGTSKRLRRYSFENDANRRKRRFASFCVGEGPCHATSCRKIRNEVEKGPPSLKVPPSCRKTLLVASPKIHYTTSSLHHFITSLMNIRGPLPMNSFPPPNLTLAYWSMLLDIFCPIYELSGPSSCKALYPALLGQNLGFEP